MKSGGLSAYRMTRKANPATLTSYGQVPLGLEGSGAFRRPGSIVRVLRTERWVRPTERAGSEGSFICRCLGQRKPLQPPCGRGNAIPLWWLAPPPFPRKRGHYKAPLCCELLMKRVFRGVLFCPLNRGKSGAARIGGGERTEPISRMPIMPYDTARSFRNADFISIAAERQSATL